MPATKPKQSAARQRIIKTAERLFYSEGIHSVGIDRIIAEAEVAKMTLYNHFASKDDLILEVLKYRDEQVNAFFVKQIEEAKEQGEEPVEALFTAIKKWFDGNQFRGCSFINANVELANPKHPAAQYSGEHKQIFREMIASVIKEQSGAKKAKELTDAIYLLIEGAIVTAQMYHNSDSADVARDAALKLLNISR